jgi:site-specific recombinase XerD
VPGPRGRPLPAPEDLVNGWLRTVGPLAAQEYARDWLLFCQWWRARGLAAGRELGAGPADAAEYRDWLGASGAAPATAQRRLAALSSLWTHVARELAPHGRALPNPWAPRVLRRPRVEDRLVERILDEDQVARLLVAARAIGPMHYAGILLLYDTGMRASEAVGLTWTSVYRTARGLALDFTAKGGRRRRIPLSARAYAALSACRRGEHLLHTVDGRAITRFDLRKMVRRAGRAAGLPSGLTTHWLRHTAASHALWHGAPVTAVQAALGHASIRTTARYTHLQADSGLTDWLPGAERAR